MKALVLSGGFGTRLRPITCTKPKLLLPVINRPILEHIAESYTFDEIILAVNWLNDRIETFIAEKGWNNIIICKESKPLGTGGAIKNAERFLDDTFVVFNGDVLSSISMNDFIDFHKRKRTLATDALFSVDEVERFGVAELNGEKIVRFVEKPPKEEAPSNLINAGIYCFEPEILDLIEPATKVSLEREIFPKLVGMNELYGYSFGGYWFDIGKPQDYLEANIALLGENRFLAHSSSIIPPKMEKSVIGRDCDIIESEIKNSVIFDCARISHSIISNSIVSSKAIITNAILEGCLIGESATISGKWQSIEACPGEELRSY